MAEEPSEQRKYADEMGEEEILNSSLSQIRRATEEKLGRSVEIHAIGYPEHFKNVPCGTKLLNTAIKAESVPEIKDMMQMGLYLHYIRLAYEPFSSEALGYPPETDHSDFHTLLLYIDYKKDFLQVSIMEVAGPLSVRDRFFRMDNFGGSDNIASVRKENMSQIESQEGFNIILLTLLSQRILPILKSAFKTFLMSRSGTTSTAKPTQKTSASSSLAAKLPLPSSKRFARPSWQLSLNSLIGFST